MNDSLMLSVVIISYKQVNYIRDAIESVLSQKVNFKFELLLADDCSNDGTLEIEKEYAKKYPEIVKVLERKKNMGGTNNIFDAATKTKGKYFTLLEGDDYWCDANKLQQQVDFLEKNHDYIGISHLQEGRNLNGMVLGNFPKGIKKDSDIELNDVLNMKFKYSFSATLYRNIYKEKDKKNDIKELLSYDSVIGDSQMCFYLLTLGKIRVLNSAMMVYRMRTNDGNSNFNSSCKVNEIEMRYLKIYKKMDDFFDHKYNFYKKIRNSAIISIAYSLIKFDFKSVSMIIKECPKKYRLGIILIFPIECIKIVYKRFIKK